MGYTFLSYPKKENYGKSFGVYPDDRALGSIIYIFCQFHKHSMHVALN